jgi:hypothetical protein
MYKYGARVIAKSMDDPTLKPINRIGMGNTVERLVHSGLATLTKSFKARKWAAGNYKVTVVVGENPDNTICEVTTIVTWPGAEKGGIHNFDQVKKELLG